MRFDDYHRTVVGYHGTRLSVALDIVNRRQAFEYSENKDDWLGHGIYFWEYAPQQALWWAKRRSEQHEWTEPIAILGAMIRLGCCLDLLDPYNCEYLKEIHEGYQEAMQAAGTEAPRNANHRKYLDCAVFNYAYALGNGTDKGAAVDSARAVYVPTGGERRIWTRSWISTKAHIQICVRNSACILGAWLHHPATLEESDEDQANQAAAVVVEPEDPIRGSTAEGDADAGSNPTAGSSQATDPDASGRGKTEVGGSG